MSEPPIDPLPPSLAALFERESNAYVEDPGAKARVLERVSRAAAFSLPVEGPRVVDPTTTAPAPAHALAKAASSATTFTGAKVAVLMAAAFLLGGVSGAVAVRVGGRAARVGRAPEPMTSDVATEPSSTGRPGSGDWTVVTAPSSATANALNEALPRPGPVPRGAGNERGTGSLTREREILDAARAALVHGQFDDALRALRQHEHQWPHGALEEEREALAIQALVAAGNGDEAKARGARFRRAYPDSLLVDVVAAALARVHERDAASAGPP